MLVACQGKSKIKNPDVKRNMKMKLRTIITETDVIQFAEKTEEYFEHLRVEGETDFLKYLQNYYFQNEERIMMWAHCYRINAGINTNMALESLNRVLKYDTLSGNCNIRIEKLLDMLEELVADKMWKIIVDTERPNANNYHHKVIVEAHKKAEQLMGHVQMIGCGKFEVQSGSENEKYYHVVSNEICDELCRLGYCNICKICLHVLSST
uniref:RGS domain-containing protein n=1 Tax=Dendroctonus ponderosae TaxID=77166 RepID=A0AAR5PBG9_DENPD